MTMIRRTMMIIIVTAVMGNNNRKGTYWNCQHSEKGPKNLRSLVRTLFRDKTEKAADVSIVTLDNIK